MKKFEEFHKYFKGDTYDLCVGCGACESSCIATLLWGEKEFISKSMKVPLHVFEDRYLDRLETHLGCVDVLKLEVCSFLDQEKRCTIKNFKVIVCDIYPLWPFVEDNVVRYELDVFCPLSKNPEVSQYFLGTGVYCLRKLDIPPEWVKIISLYNDFNFDFKKIGIWKEKHQMKEKYVTIALPEIMKFRL